MVELQLIGMGIGLFFLLASMYFLWKGIRNYRFARILGTATPVDRLTHSGQLTVVNGTVEGPVDGSSLESGFSGMSCVAYVTKKIKQKAPSTEDIRYSHNFRERIREHHEAIPFRIETNEGSARVEASNAHVAVSEDHYEPVSLHDVRTNRGTLIGLWWLVRDLLTTWNRQVRRNYLEALFRTGDTVQVIGEFGTAGSGEGTLRKPAGAPLVVTSVPQTEVVDRFKSGGIAQLIGGILLLVIGTGSISVVTGGIG